MDRSRFVKIFKKTLGNTVLSYSHLYRAIRGDMEPWTVIHGGHPVNYWPCTVILVRACEIVCAGAHLLWLISRFAAHHDGDRYMVIDIMFVIGKWWSISWWWSIAAFPLIITANTVYASGIYSCKVSSRRPFHVSRSWELFSPSCRALWEMPSRSTR
jgi:hypothetical protein